MTKRIFKLLLLSFVLICGTAISAVNDLPVKKIDGQDCYVYTVGDNENLYAVSDKLGVSRTDILKYNYAAKNGVRKGMKLYFPVADYGIKYGKVTGKIEHIARSTDTYLSLARKYNVPADVLLVLNPGINKGIKEGQIIIIPVGPNGVASYDDDDEAETVPSGSVASDETSSGDSTAAVVTPIAEKPVAESEPADEPAVVTPVEVSLELTPVDVPVAAKDSVRASEGLNVVVCLPFELKSETPGKNAVYATDFYRGFLLGVDTLRAYYGYPTINITALDCTDAENSKDFIRDNRDALLGADIIIAPESAEKLAGLGAFAASVGVYVFNNFDSRDTSYESNPYVLQVNVPTATMYDKAIDWFVAHLDGARPVFLDNERGKKDKQSFVEALIRRLDGEGIRHSTLTFDGTLTSSALTGALTDAAESYVFVPMSGALAEFQKVSSALANFKSIVEADMDAQGRVRLFGYPEYTRFSGDSYDKMKAIDTSFYTRFYSDPYSAKTSRVERSYINRYGTTLPEGVPNQALYGFDVANWLIALAQNGAVDRDTVEGTVLNDGVQMMYYFRPVEEGGFVNDATLIVTLNGQYAANIEVL